MCCGDRLKPPHNSDIRIAAPEGQLTSGLLTLKDISWPPLPINGPIDLRVPGRSRSNALADLLEIFEAMTPFSALGGVQPNGHWAIIHERNLHLGTETAAAYGDAMLSDLRLEVLVEAWSSPLEVVRLDVWVLTRTRRTRGWRARSED